MRNAFWIVLVVLCVACSGKGVRVLSEREMEAVLRDYHVALSLVRQADGDSTLARQYMEALFEKHNITQADFDSSMVYYMKHADRMHIIYERLSDRLTNEGRLQGVASENLLSSTVNEGDTANIWPMEPRQVLSVALPNNFLTFHIVADTTFYKGDKFIMSFQTDFLSSEHSRSGIVLMSVRFANDSIVTRSKTVSSRTPTTFEVDDETRLGVTDIRGFFLHRYIPPANAADDKNSTTLQLMLVSDIRLIKMHTPEPEVVEEVKEEIVPDTLKTDSITKQIDNNETNKPDNPPVDGKHSD